MQPPWKILDHKTINKSPTPGGTWGIIAQSKTYIKASPTTIERKLQFVAVYGQGLRMILFSCLISRSGSDYIPPI